MRLFLYSVLVALAAVAARAWLWCSPSRRALLGRFAPETPVFGGRPIWVQACSLGEVNTVRPLIDAIRDRVPGHPVLVTASTVTGIARARLVFGVANVAWFPVDTRRSVGRFVAAVNPAMLVLVETELWPNTIAACTRRGIPVLLVNGRLSDKHLHRYQRFRRWFQPLVHALAAAGMQSEAHAERILALGARPGAVRVTGNLKFDAVHDQVSPRERQRTRKDNGFRPEGRVLLFGSTRPGDEALAAECWRRLREDYPDLSLVVAPRHPARVEEIVALFGEPVCRRSRVLAGERPKGERVFLVDTTGELVAFLSFASVAVVGGSFFAGVNGHNPLEPAALGVPAVFGPYMRNFEEAAAILVERDGARQVDSPEALYPALHALLGSAAVRRQMGTRARKAVLDNQGATRATLALIQEVLEARPAVAGKTGSSV